MYSKRRKNIIFSLDEFESSSNWPLLAELPINKMESWKQSLDLIVSGLLSDNSGSIAFFLVGEIDQSMLSYLNQTISSVVKDRQVKLTQDLIEATKFSNLIVLTALGITQRSQFIEINKKLSLQKKPVLGLISITESKVFDDYEFEKKAKEIKVKAIEIGKKIAKKYPSIFNYINSNEIKVKAAKIGKNIAKKYQTIFKIYNSNK